MMKKILERCLTVDRRIIFLFIAIAAFIPVVFPLKLPIFVTPEVLGVYNEIEALPEGSPILVAFDYEPVSTPEMEPMSRALLRHMFRKKLRVVGVTITDYGVGMGERMLAEMEKEFNLDYGKDFVFLGYRPGRLAVVIGLGQNLRATYKFDNYGKPTEGMEILKDIQTLRDFPYMVDIHDDGWINYWVIYGYERYGIKIGAASSAIMATGIYPFLQAGQLTGIIGGLKGASEYEKLVATLGAGAAGMDVLSIIYVFAIFLILLSNFAYMVLRKG